MEITEMTFLPYAALKSKGIPFGRDHLAAMVKQGQFPAPCRLGPKKHAWLEAEIDRWLQDRIAARGKPQSAAA
jgi:prophage regulatory protein